MEPIKRPSRLSFCCYGARLVVSLLLAFAGITAARTGLNEYPARRIDRYGTASRLDALRQRYDVLNPSWSRGNVARNYETLTFEAPQKRCHAPGEGHFVPWWQLFSRL